MKRASLLLVSVLFMLALAFLANAEPDITQTDCLYYFYGEECVDCFETSLYIEDLKEQYPKVKIKEYEVYHNMDNLGLLNNFYNSYNVPANQQQVPVIFFSRTYFVGMHSIQNFLEDRILLNNDDTCPSVEHDDVVGLLGSGEPKDVLKLLNFASITGTGVGNTVSNTSMAVLLIFLLLLMALAKEKEIHKDEEDNIDIGLKKEHLLRNSLIYILIIYFMLLLSGLGVANFSFFTTKALIFSRLVALLAIVIGLVSIKHFVIEGHPIIPRNYLKPILPIWTKIRHYSISTFGFIVIAIIASFYVAGSWDGQYQLIQKLLTSSTLRWKVLPLFLWHNILLLIPFSLIFAIAFWKLDKIKEVKTEKVKMYHIQMLGFLFACLATILGFITLFYV